MPNNQGGFPNPISTETFQQFVENIFQILEKVAIAALAVCIVYAGYLFSSAQGDPEKVNRAKRAIFWGIVGAGVVFLGKSLAKMIIQAIT